MVTKVTMKAAETSKASTEVKTKPAAKGKIVLKEKLTAPAKPKEKTASQEKALATAKSIAKEKITTVSHEFSLNSPDAKDVFLVGEFNNWDVTALRMKKSRNGSFTISVKLAPGRYEYLFNVDGQWVTDPASSERVSNPFGSENSVVTLG